MVQFLSPEWIERLDAAAAAAAPFDASGADGRLVIEQRVIGGPQGDVTYHVSIGDGHASVRPGPSDAASVTFTAAYRTARDINRGEQSAQEAFMNGELQVGGDVRALLRHRAVLAELEDAFGELRSETSY